MSKRPLPYSRFAALPRGVIAAIALTLVVACGGTGPKPTEPEGPPPLTADERESLATSWQLFVDRDPRWRDARSAWLARSDAARNTLVENLIRHMSDRYQRNDLDEAHRAASELVLLDRDAVDYLLAILRGDGSRRAIGIRDMAAGCLVSIGEPAVPGLIDALGDTGYAARRLAARALGRIRDRRAVVPLVGVLDADANFVVRVDAAHALGGFADSEPASTALRAHLGDDDALVASAVATSLGRLKHADAVPALVERLEATEREFEGEGTGQLRRTLRAALAKITGLSKDAKPEAFRAWRPPA